MAHHLFIVSRQEPALYSYLSHQFSGEPEVTVILDRRQGERRDEEKGEQDTNRQQAERRLKAALVEQLSTLGYAFVRIA